MKQANSGKSGAVRVSTLDATDLAAMERHGQREDASGQARRVSDDEPLVRGGLDLVARREKHVEGLKQQGKTKAMHALVQFPSELVPDDPRRQRAMMTSAVEFINDFYGGDAVFSARLDRDERGTHKVDVFFLPRWEFEYKDGRKQGRCGIGQYTKKEARRRSGKDDRRAQGTALQDALFEHLRDRMRISGVMPPERKKTTTRDRLEPEAYAITQEKSQVQRKKSDLDRRSLSLTQRELQVADDAKFVAMALKKIGQSTRNLDKVIQRHRDC